MRKSRDYVYRMWRYEMRNIKNGYLTVKNRKVNNMQIMDNVQNMDKGKKSIENPCPLYKTYTPTVI